jgi:serine/threonine protein kinase
LEKILKEKRQNFEFFSEEKLWAMLEGLIEALAHLQENDIVHSNIQPLNIYQATDEKFKLTVYGVFNPKSLFEEAQFTFQENEIPHYLSPVLFQV